MGRATPCQKSWKIELCVEQFCSSRLAASASSKNASKAIRLCAFGFVDRLLKKNFFEFIFVVTLNKTTTDRS